MQAVLCAICLGMEAHKRPPLLRFALKELFEEQLEIDIPEVDQFNLKSSAGTA